MSNLNIYVNSKNRKSDVKPSDFSDIIPNSLLKVNKNEYFTMSVNSFYCNNDFANVIILVIVLMQYLEII